MFQVFDSGRPAILPRSDKFKNCVFDTFKEAVIYAESWLGERAPEEGYIWEIDVPYYYLKEYGTDYCVIIKKI